MADLIGEILVLPPGTLVLQATRPIDAQQAARVRQTVFERTGRDVVILGDQLRVACVLDDFGATDPGTPIFDQLLEERRAPGAFLHPLNVAEVIAPSPRLPAAGLGR